ncbi:hypothetical protein [Acinetobacter ursingii]|uniref:hypothetical protein n=1 Tax=Acinetobacter ursingii TaxID=108980 RepID=UPI00124FCCE4|nr:hypothetical protein [Acinetobacter ursingii]
MKSRSITGTYLIGGARGGEFYKAEIYPHQSILIHHHEPHESLYIFDHCPPLKTVEIKADRYVVYPVRYSTKSTYVQKWFLIHTSLIYGEDSQTLDESVIKQAISLIESDLGLWGILK